jgi:hypothetical protein
MEDGIASRDQGDNGDIPSGLRRPNLEEAGMGERSRESTRDFKRLWSNVCSIAPAGGGRHLRGPEIGQVAAMRYSKVGEKRR